MSLRRRNKINGEATSLVNGAQLLVWGEKEKNSLVEMTGFEEECNIRLGKIK